MFSNGTSLHNCLTGEPLVQEPVPLASRYGDAGLQSRDSLRGSRRNLKQPMLSASNHSTASSNSLDGNRQNLKRDSTNKPSEEMATPPLTKLAAIASFGEPLNAEPKLEDGTNSPQPMMSAPAPNTAEMKIPAKSSAGTTAPMNRKMVAPMGKALQSTSNSRKVSCPPEQYRTTRTSRRSTAISRVSSPSLDSKKVARTSTFAQPRNIANEKAGNALNEKMGQGLPDENKLSDRSNNKNVSNSSSRRSAGDKLRKGNTQKGSNRISNVATSVVRRVSNRLSRRSRNSNGGTTAAASAAAEIPRDDVVDDAGLEGKSHRESRRSQAISVADCEPANSNVDPKNEKRTPESLNEEEYQSEAVGVGAFRVGPVDDDSFRLADDYERDVEMGSPKVHKKGLDSPGLSPKKTDSLVKKLKADENMRDNMVQELSAMLVVEGEEDYYIDDDDDDDKNKAMLVHAEPVVKSRSKYIWRRFVCIFILLALVGGIGAAVVLSKRTPTKNANERDAAKTRPPRPEQAPPDETIKLQLIFSGDHESYMQDTNTLEELVINYSALYSGLMKLGEMENMHSLHLQAGDLTLPNLFFDASQEIESIGVPGGVDYMMLNEMNVSGTVVGNNDMDAGLDAFANFISKADFPILSADLDFSNVTLGPDVVSPIRIGEDGARCSDVAGMIARSCYYDHGNVKVGLIGRGNDDLFNSVKDAEEVLPGLKFYTGRNSETNTAADVLKPIQEQVQVLKENGVEVIVLLDNSSEEYDFASDELIASSMEGISIVVSAGRALQAFESTSSGPFGYLREEEVEWKQVNEFPIVRRDKLGNPVLYVHTLGLYRYIGHLIAEFDLDGTLISWDSDRSGPIATTKEGISKLAEYLGVSDLDPVDGVTELFKELQATPSVTEGFVKIGTTDFPLIPSREEETNMNRLIVDAYHWEARRVASETLGNETNVDIALINTGGIRNSIQGPNIIRLSIDTTIAFNNAVRLIEINGAQLLAALENGVSRAGNRCGCFPSVSGLRFEFDETKPAALPEESITTPSRIKSLVLYPEDCVYCETILVSDFVVQDGFLERTFIVATHGFLAGGGSGYVSLEGGTTYLQTESREQQLLTDYIVEVMGGVVDLATPPPGPIRITNVA